MIKKKDCILSLSLISLVNTTTLVSFLNVNYSSLFEPYQIDCQSTLLHNHTHQLRSNHMVIIQGIQINHNELCSKLWKLFKHPNDILYIIIIIIENNKYFFVYLRTSTTISLKT